MSRPSRFKAETKYGKSQEKKANRNLPMMARVGNGGGVEATDRDNFYWIRLVNDDNRLTQCYSLLPLTNNDYIYVRRARDRDLSYYEFDKFIQGAGGTAPPTQVHDHSDNAHGGQLIDLDGAADALVLDTDGDTSISSPVDDQIDFEVANADQVHLIDDVLYPDQDDDVDLGDATHEWKDVYVDGVVYADTVDLEGNADALVLDDDGDTSISSPVDDQIDFEVANADQIHLIDGVLYPDQDDDIDLGDATHEFKDAYFDGTIYADDIDTGNLDVLVGMIIARGGIDIFGVVDGLVLDADDDTTISAPTDDQIDFEVGGADVARLFPGGWTGDTFAFTVKNTSGGVAAANDLGYIDEAGEYKTTATAYSDVEWCVVLEGGANNADIHVARRGRVTVTLNGNCNAGDYLYTSTTAGQAQPQSYTRPELFAVALTANALGAGGTCSALLLCHRKKSPLTDANYTVDIRNASSSTWSSTINGAPVGAVVTYNVPIAGNEDSIVPNAAGMLAKPVLHNITRGDYALIQSVNTVANTITLTAAAPGAWANGDSIQVNSLTCIIGAPLFFDMEFEDTTVVPQLAVGFGEIISYNDAAAANQWIGHHPFQAYAGSKLGMVTGQVANQSIRSERFIPIFQRRFCYRWSASGAGTANHWSQLAYIVVAAP